MRFINMIVIHCTASLNGKSVSLDTVREWHKQRGFDDIGYHYLIDVDGKVGHGRPLEKMGAHAKGSNAHSIGICLVGGIEAKKPGEKKAKEIGRFTKAQWESLRGLVDDLEFLYPGSVIVGHRDLSPDLDGDGIVEPEEWIKTCPGFDVSQWRRAGCVPEAENVYPEVV